MRRTMDMQRQLDALRNDRAAEGQRVSVFGGSQADADRDRLKQDYLSLSTNPTLKDLYGSGFYGGRRGQAAGGGGEYATRLGAMAQALGLDNKAASDQAGNAAMLERERMQQSGADRRAAAGFTADQPYRAAQTEGLGFQNRAARQMEQLRDNFFNAKTQEEKNQALEALRAIFGKDETGDGRFKPVTLTDASGNQTVVGFDSRSGSPVGTQGSIDQNPAALAVKNDPNLSREQKVERLKAMGY
jgi:hypothetical protein